MQHLDNYEGPEPSDTVRDLLLRRGGTSPSGHPLYRLVRSEYIYEQSGGLWHDWDDDLSDQDRGGMYSQGDGTFRQSLHRPTRIVAELRTVPAYTHLDEQGWILERWFPDNYFGSREYWESMKVPETSLLMLGDFPSQGKYLMQVGPFTIEPDASFLVDFIAHRESKWEDMPSDIDIYIKNKVRAAEDRYAKMAEKRIEEDHRHVMDSVKPLTSSTLEAGRWRDKMFRRSGHLSHMGN